MRYHLSFLRHLSLSAPTSQMSRVGLFVGDAFDDGPPTVGKKFKISNRHLPVPAGTDRQFVETSTVQWVSEIQCGHTRPDGYHEEFIYFQTKNSEYVLTWVTM